METLGGVESLLNPESRQNAQGTGGDKFDFYKHQCEQCLKQTLLNESRQARLNLADAVQRIEVLHNITNDTELKQRLSALLQTLQDADPVQYARLEHINQLLDRIFHPRHITPAAEAVNVTLHHKAIEQEQKGKVAPVSKSETAQQSDSRLKKNPRESAAPSKTSFWKKLSDLFSS